MSYVKKLRKRMKKFFKTFTDSIPMEPLDLRASKTNHYKRNFQEFELLGSGTFGSVHRCLNRLDGCVYAVKRSKCENNRDQRRAKNEVRAHAVLNGHRNIVTYYSAWIQDDCLSIQTDYYSDGDLGMISNTMTNNQTFFDEKELHKLLVQIADGLKHIHDKKLVHMDIKPDNILVAMDHVSSTKRRRKPSQSSDFDKEVVYKIGDFGHVTSIDKTTELEDEGDCRYLPKEIMQEDYTDLRKADIFALGLTIYEVGGGGPLPKNGPEWHSIRDGNLKRLTRYSDDLNNLLALMIHFDPKKRPSATEILQREFLHS